ncbi:hypothetical protein [Hyphomicrobium sp.]|uniref:YncE family protein n=1 Tax=Hyphomicrobium sp. TaxID=82 RepID=UPI000FB50A02|nr:hypothetical protein [Hyphomicrobium sp.]RUP00347.1 MAG: hypothetical protein EKK30_01955 [Hyphomicrobium sp.]
MQKLARTHGAGELTRETTIDQGTEPRGILKRFHRALAIVRTAVTARLIVIAAIAAAGPGIALSSYADDVPMPPIEPATEAGAPPIDVFKPGDIAASSFSGTKLIVQSLPPGVDPVSKSFLDPDGVVLRVYSLGNLPSAATGQILGASPVFEGKARDLGQVFALAFEKASSDKSTPPALYAAASSAFGLQIIAPDKNGGGPTRIWKGAPGAAFMPGQFGGLPSSGPGTIYKIDRANGDIRVFGNVATNGIANSGPGLGGLAFDPASKTLYASDLDTGLIHAFSADGSDVAQFDHGADGRPVGKRNAVGDNGKRADISSPEFIASDPATWGFTQTERRIDAIAIHDGRLYYAAADGPEIWSIGIDSSGKFTKDPRLELAPSTVKPFPITAIVFDAAGRMIITQRGTQDNPADYSQFTTKGPAQTLRFTPENPDNPQTPGQWKPTPDEYAVGNIEDFRASSGGLAIQYGYRDDGSIDLSTCSGTIIASGDALGAQKTAFGLQLSSIERVRPANAPPVQTSIIDLDAKQDDPAARGHAGGIAVLRDCAGGAGGFPAVAGGEGGEMPPVAGGEPGGGSPGATGGGEMFPQVDESAEGGGGTVTDDQQGGGGTTTNGPLTMTKSPGSATCAENQSCSFKITVTNNGDKPVDKIVFTDNPTIGGAPFTKFKLGDVAAPWKCEASAAPGMQCTNADPLQPKASTELTLSFTPDPGSLAGASELKNCAAFPAGANQQGNGPQQALPPPPPPSGTNNGGLKVEMAPTAASCSPATGNCEFKLTITNTTGQPITAPLKIFNTLAVGTQSQAKNEAKSMQLPAGLTCQPEGREFNCSQDQLTLAPNGALTMSVAYSVDTTEGGDANFVQNKSAVTFGPLTGEATAAVAFVDNAKLPEPGADAQKPGNAGPAEPACASIPIAPSGPIVVNKKGPAKCAIKGPCAFTIDVTNASNAPVQGPIEIEDTIDLPNATIATPVAAPFSCDAAGPPFKCKFDGTLQPKETKTLALTLNIDAPAGTKSLKNCAVPTQPQAAGGQGGAGQGQGGGGKGQQKNQLAPGKKSDLFPFGRKAIFDFAAFRPQSLPHATSLLHFTGGAGGNIGGVGPNKCKQWGMPQNGFNIIQSNGPHVGFGDVKVGPDGKVTGTASFISNDGPVGGTVTGTIIGSQVDLTVNWKNNNVKSGHYTGTIEPDGDFSGLNRASNGNTATFKSSKIWFKCSLDDLCQKYADDAIATVREFQSLKCGSVGPGRFSLNKQEHIDWCMAQTRGGGSPIPVETEERTKRLDSCRAFDAKCTQAGLAIAAKNDEMKALNCKDAIPSLQPDRAKDACKAAALKASPEALVQGVQEKLDACKLAKLNGDGGAGAPGGAGGAGDPGAGGPANPGNDNGANGQGGDQVQQPAGNQCVTVELEEKPAPNPQQAGKLALSKNPAAGKCTSTGGGCDFVISVFNPDPAVDFVGPVDFTDHISQPDGSPFPNVTVQTPINPLADSGIKGGVLGCRKNGNDVNCTSSGASLTIPPGKKILIPMSFTPGGDTTAKAVKNCASLPGGEQQCVTIPFGENGPLLRAKKIAVGNPQTCVPNCEFIITMSNVGTTDAQGPFVLKDVFTAANGFDSFKMIGDSAFACTSTNGTIGCISTNKGANTLRPGETISGVILFNISSVSPEYKNCVQYDPAVQAKPSPFDQDAGPLCAVVKDTAHAGPNLLMQLTAPNEGPDGVGECAINSPCRFQTLVRSNGTVDFPERARFTATVSPNVPQSLKAGDNRWICSPNNGGKIECSDGLQQKLLAVGNQLPGEIEVLAGPGWQKNDTLTLCAKIAPANSKSDTNPADDLACKSVKLDPFNVKVSKTGDQSCTPGGDCHFAINLFNPGPIDHNAPVTITDHLNGLSSATIVSINPPLPCATQPTQIPFSCTSPGNVCLKIGAKAGDACGPLTFQMVVRLPNDTSATQFANCVSVTAGEKSRSDDESCHPVSLKPVVTTVPPPRETAPVVTTPPRECFGGMIMVGNLCQCPPGSRFNGRRCFSDGGEGGAYPAVQPGNVVVPVEPPRCPAFRPVGIYPNCCPLGTDYRFGACRRPSPIVVPPPAVERPPVCPSYRPVGTYPNCCPLGMEYRYGSCRRRGTTGPGTGGADGTYPNTEPPSRKCPSFRPIGTYPNCCPLGMEFRFGSCRRAPTGGGGADGTIPGTELPPRKCPSFRPIGMYPNCCPIGMEFRNGSCRRPSTSDQGSGGTNGTTSPDDRKCPPGYHRLRRPNKYGAYCEPDQSQKCPPSAPEGTPPNCHCPAGTVSRGGFCRPASCGPNMTGTPPNCHRICPPGTVNRNETCVQIQKPPPKKTPPNCTGGKVPRNPDGLCVCPAGFIDQGGRCVPRGPA